MLAALLLAYKARLIQRHAALSRSIVVGGTWQSHCCYLVSLVLNMFHVATPFLYQLDSPLSIGLSLVVSASRR